MKTIITTILLLGIVFSNVTFDNLNIKEVTYRGYEVKYSDVPTKEGHYRVILTMENADHKYTFVDNQINLINYIENHKNIICKITYKGKRPLESAIKIYEEGGMETRNLFIETQKYIGKF